MALVVEDGTGVAGAESYATIAFMDDYHAKRNNSAWALIPTIAIKEGLARIATEYMVATFRGNWKGAKQYFIQALDWPRVGAVRDGDDAYNYGYGQISPNTIPNEVMQSCAEYALAALAGPLLVNTTRGKKNVQIGPIKIEYDGDGPMATHFLMASSRLQPLLAMGGSTMVGLIRS